MTADWKDYKNWKETLNESKNTRREDETDIIDDDVTDLTEMFREYID